MKKKPLIIILSVAAGITLLYSGIWLFYKNYIWMSHVNGNSVLKSEKNGLLGGQSYYVEADDKYNHYAFKIPSFGSFCCYCSAGSSLAVDKSSGVVDEEGSTGYQTVNASGSPFDYMMIAEFGMNGLIKCYKFNVCPMPAQEQYPDAAFFRLDENAELLNSDGLSEKELKLYHASKDEMSEFIKKTNELFNITA